MKVSRVARAAAAMLVGTMLANAPALAQQPSRVPAAGQAQPQRAYTLSRAEQVAFNPLVQANAAAEAARVAGQTADWAAVRALVPAAQAAARGNDARYLLARVQLSLALGTNDVSGQEQALTALLANPSTTAAERTTYLAAQDQLLNNRAQAAFAANDFTTAERIYRQLLQLNPNDTRVQNNLRIVQERSGNTGGALESLTQQIRAAEASGGRAPEELLQRAFQIPYRARQRPQAAEALNRLITAYPTPQNWRTALTFVRERAGSDIQYQVDALRFARIVNAIQPAEFLPLAGTLDQAGLPGEVKSIIDAGTAAGAVRSAEASRLLSNANRRIAEDRAGLPGQISAARSAAGGRQARVVGDVLYGYDRFAEAADLYRVALSKGGEDANLVNTRLGAALARAGQRAPAEAALRAVTGPRAELAQLWLAWLARSGG